MDKAMDGHTDGNAADAKAQLLGDLRDEQARWEALLRAIGEDRMTQPGVAGEWSVKDIIAHLTGWRRRTVARFQAALRHEPSPPTLWPAHLQTDDEVNAWIYAANRDRTLAEVLRDSREVFQQLVETLDAFPAADLRDPARFPWLGSEDLPLSGAAFFGHFHEEHEPDMWAWLQRMTFSAQTSITIDAPSERVWDALVNPAMVALYLHGTTMRADWRVGGAITWSGEWNGKQYEDKGVILRFEPLRIVSTTHWSPLSGSEDKPENYHVVTYELTDGGDQTTLTLTQGNSPTQQDADSMIENGWKPTLQTLKQQVEG